MQANTKRSRSDQERSVCRDSNISPRNGAFVVVGQTIDNLPEVADFDSSPLLAEVLCNQTAMTLMGLVFAAQ